MIPGHVAAIAGSRDSAASFVVSADTANLDLHAFAAANGYSSGPITIEIAAGIEVYSATSAAALIVGAFSPGDVVTLIHKGTMTGKAGNGGDGEPGDGVTLAGNGQAGGTALDATSATGFVFRLDRKAGSIIRGGGGGGGGGGAGVDADAFINGVKAGGGGGGGGQGRSAATGGAGKPSVGAAPVVNGSNGAVRVGGAGGSIADISYTTAQPYTGGKGGDGGTYGQAGASGVNGSPGVADPGTGGAAGKSIDGLANVVVISSGGSLIGPTA